MKIKEKLIKELGLSDFDNDFQSEIVEDIIALLIEKSLDDLLENFSEEELSQLKKSFGKENVALKVASQYKNKIKKFQLIFKNNLNEFVRKIKAEQFGNRKTKKGPRE